MMLWLLVSVHSNRIDNKIKSNFALIRKKWQVYTSINPVNFSPTSNVASAAELTKGGAFKDNTKAKALDWL